MRDILAEVAGWWAEGCPIALATVVATSGSAPRQVGATMAVGPGAEVLGSVSGGCVEGAVYETAQEVLGTGVPCLSHYGVSDEDAFSVGLTCGGELDVFVQRVDPSSHPEVGDVADDVRLGRPVAIATIVEHPSAPRVGRHLVVRPADDTRPAPKGGLGSPRLDAAVRDDAHGLIAGGADRILTYGPDGERQGNGVRVFVACFTPPPRMIVVGAVDLAGALAEIGAFLGYRVTVCDARSAFATPRRFPAADDVVVDWPHRYLSTQAEAGALDDRTVIAVLTHDPKFDVPALEVALRLPVGFVGAMGSRRTHRDRLERLRAIGLGDAELARLASPIGLDLGARTPEETAVSVAAEIVSRRWGGTGRPLGSLSGPIHQDVASALRR